MEEWEEEVGMGDEGEEVNGGVGGRHNMRWLSVKDCRLSQDV